MTAPVRHVEDFTVSAPAMAEILALVGAIPAGGVIRAAEFSPRLDAHTFTVEHAGARPVVEGATPYLGGQTGLNDLAERFEAAAKRLRRSEREAARVPGVCGPCGRAFGPEGLICPDCMFKVGKGECNLCGAATGSPEWNCCRECTPSPAPISAETKE